MKRLLVSLLFCLCLATYEGQAQDALVSLQQAVAMVKKDPGVRVLKAGEIRIDGRRTFRIKILDEKGHVRTLYLDAKQ